MRFSSSNRSDDQSTVGNCLKTYDTHKMHRTIVYVCVPVVWSHILQYAHYDQLPSCSYYMAHSLSYICHFNFMWTLFASTRCCVNYAQILFNIREISLILLTQSILVVTCVAFMLTKRITTIPFRISENCKFSFQSSVCSTWSSAI